MREFRSQVNRLKSGGFNMQKGPNPFWKHVYKGLIICVNNYVKMYPEEFIYYPLYNQKEITSDLISVGQPWCRNLIVADIINKKMEFRSREAITMVPRKITDYEY